MMAELIEQKKASFERMIGCSLDPLLEVTWLAVWWSTYAS
jgi:hypothetical protein